MASAALMSRDPGSHGLKARRAVYPGYAFARHHSDADLDAPAGSGDKCGRLSGPATVRDDSNEGSVTASYTVGEGRATVKIRLDGK